ncbi:unnamed protein product [Heligmosomoides polygyrus]|uniref:ATPase_AAA_core domain-containing protein n=1 Tax=Heligmosomoides polygyrus TaxID=6339 RepID=A0A183FIS8_HELPZ|nr:unnamed protein product [Heligmosomoides polygyrus]
MADNQGDRPARPAGAAVENKDAAHNDADRVPGGANPPIAEATPAPIVSYTEEELKNTTDPLKILSYGRTKNQALCRGLRSAQGYGARPLLIDEIDWDIKTLKDHVSWRKYQPLSDLIPDNKDYYRLIVAAFAGCFSCPRSRGRN